MQIYWTLKSIPELSEQSWKERNVRWRMAARQTLGHWQVWLGLAGCGACAVIGTYFGELADMRMVGAGVGGGFGGFVFSQVRIAIARKYYRHTLLHGQPDQNDVPNI